MLNYINLLDKKILDIRSNESVKIIRLNASYHIPSLSLRERMFELCEPRQIYVISSNTDIEVDAINFLISKGYKVDVIKECEEFIEKCKFLNGITKFVDYRLWEPSPLINQRIDTIEEILPMERRLAMDIGCGSGRDCVFLSRRGWKVFALDSNKTSIDKLTEFKGDLDVIPCHVKIRGDGNTRNLTTLESGSLMDVIPLEKKVDLITVIRCLPPRPSLPHLLRCLDVGGHFLFSTFIEDEKKDSSITWETLKTNGTEETFQHPKSRNAILERNELNILFCSNGYKVLIDDIFYLNDKRPISLFHAVKIE